MNVRIVVEVDGEMVAEILEDVETLDGLAVEERVEQIKQRAGRAQSLGWYRCSRRGSVRWGSRVAVRVVAVGRCGTRGGGR